MRRSRWLGMGVREDAVALVVDDDATGVVAAVVVDCDGMVAIAVEVGVAVVASDVDAATLLQLQQHDDDYPIHQNQV